MSDETYDDGAEVSPSPSEETVTDPDDDEEDDDGA